ncbi:MAG: helix-turn-helix transcriptional regulator [Candidatus Dormibacteria bacterium]
MRQTEQGRAVRGADVVTRSTGDLSVAARALGISELGLSVYEGLLANPDASVGELGSLVGASLNAVRSALASLVSAGLLGKMPGPARRLTVIDPWLALNSLLLRREEEVARTSGELMEARRWTANAIRASQASTAPPAQNVVEVIERSTATTALFEQLQNTAEREFIGIERAPYVLPVPGNHTELALLEERRIRYRYIYEQSAFAIPEKVAWIQRYIEAGEEARVLPQVPIRFLASDRKVGMTPLGTGTTSISGPWLLIHDSPILQALVELFETLWQRAVPVRAWLAGAPPAGRGGPSEQDRRILGLLGAGLKDAMIAQQLGISEATVLRRVRALMDQFGVSTRFQAGMQAARRGLI